MNDFETFWKIFPHHSTRSSKAMSKAKWDQITGDGLDAKMRDSESNYMTATHKATPEEIIKGAKAYAVSLDDKQYACGAQVWLNRARWMDFDNVDELAMRFDRNQASMQKLIASGKLRVVTT